MKSEVNHLSETPSDEVKSGSVLIADDDEALSSVMVRTLEEAGYSCTPVSDGKMAVEALCAMDFSVALLDLVMPGMDGFEVLAEIQKAAWDVVPIMLTGAGDIPRAVRAMKLGAFDFLEKPITPDLVEQAIVRAMRYRKARLHGQKMTALIEQWEATFDASPDPIVAATLDGRVIRCNKRAAQIAESSPEALVDKDSHEALCLNSHAREECPFVVSTLFKPNKPQECTMWGGVYEVTTGLMADHRGHNQGLLHLARDVTSRVEAERALRISEEKFRQMVDNIGIGVLLLDKELHILELNRQVRDWFPEIDLSEQPLCHTVLNNPANTKRCSYCPTIQTFSDGQVHDATTVTPRGDKTKNYRIISSPIHDDGGDTVAAIVMMEDVTEKLALERELQQSQKLEAVGRLAAGIAHEINTPMQYIGDNIEFLQIAFDSLAEVVSLFSKVLSAKSDGASLATLVQEGEELVDSIDLSYLTEQIPQAIEQSLEGAGRVASIVQAMKEFSHPGSSEKTPTDINECIKSTVTVSRNEWKYVAEMELDLADSLPMVSCLPGEFNQVILNMIVNAAHAIADVVGSDAEEKGTIRLCTRRDGDFVEITLSDTGPGIPEDVRSRIFDPFFTTKEVGKGTGQGLAIAHDVIVDKHDGTLKVDSEVGKGTTFTIQLPLEV